MTTASCLTAPIPLHRPWWARWRVDFQAWLDRRRIAAREHDVYDALGHLSEQTLRDIGAPAWMHERDRGAELRQLNRHEW